MGHTRQQKQRLANIAAIAAKRAAEREQTEQERQAAGRQLTASEAKQQAAKQRLRDVRAGNAMRQSLSDAARRPTWLRMSSTSWRTTRSCW
jgi:hypothetical protein